MESSSISKGTKSLGSARICVALDKSGSTAGHTLNIERKAVQEIYNLRVPNNHSSFRLIPWSDDVQDPIDLPNEVSLKGIQGRGGTNPAVLYDLNSCVETLKDCDVWFLLTDGEIVDNLVENFALRTAELGLHNKPCVIIVFGSSSTGSPANGNISVGIATFAVVPDCLFLFHDLESDVVRLMQAKGRFKNLVSVNNHRSNPLITKYTTWAELPKISYSDLFCLQIETTDPLRRDEIALPGGLIVQLDEVLKGNVDAATMEKIVKDEDNLKSIIISSMTRGTGKTLESWLAAQLKPMPEVNRHREDLDNKAKSTLRHLVEALRTGVGHLELEGLRADVRKAHHQNWSNFRDQRRGFNDMRRDYRRMQQHVRNGMDMCYTYGRMDNEWMCRDMGKPDSEGEVLIITHDDSNRCEPVFLPGFHRSERAAEFVGRCMLCHEERVLCLLFKVAPDLKTDNFPPIESFTKVAFPLAMANFAETDVLSFFICCDWCGYYLERSTACPYTEDEITFALCLVGMEENQKTWVEALDTVLKGRFDISDTKAIFLAILNYKTLDNSLRDADETDQDLFRACADWVTRHLLEITEVSAALSPNFSQNPNSDLRVPLQNLLAAPDFAEPEQPQNVDLLLIRYPIAGFTVLLRLLQLRGLGKERIQALTFFRVMFHVMEQLFMRRASGGIELFVEDVLGREQPPEDQGQTQRVMNGIGLPVEQLKAHDLLDQETLVSLEAIPEFFVIKAGAGPAMQVFLHCLFRHSNVSASAVACFNKLKGLAPMRTVLKAPLAISAGLSADLISQI
ncbi:uncharacterized protein A1O9_10269 [Exophiala aquamarina CBS 119918]|uniref:VWFA domain-containing protein n=1 Tax=Exophiala aquamarina CBS 119918 TaxID=1182545 RepID=A0A072P2E5_9EURO|nr:uncharacterized protein A1O9_10269 [Exophiala aquamarina CBS 119918]KEF53867.1 hypothetical protein A1O9_10269 [Exophiala aquamarina CBS 119918]